MFAPANLSRIILLSLRNNTSNSTLGIEATRKIASFVRPRGCKGGLKHRRIYPISTVISERRYVSPQQKRDFNFISVQCQSLYAIPTLISGQRLAIPPAVERNSTLNYVKVGRQQLCVNKLNLNGALWNARSLTGKIADISTTLIETNLDILLITETWLKSSDDPVISEFFSSISGYSIYQQPRSKRKGGGVAIIARSNLAVSSKQSHHFNSFECLEVAFKSYNQLLRVIVIYRPPNSSKNKSTMQNFLSDFSALLESAIPGPGQLLLGGDFNFHMDDSDAPDANKFKDLLESTNLCQHVNFSTHRRGHTLDLLITRSSEHILHNIRVSNILTSDHSLINFGINVSRPAIKKIAKSSRNLNEIDMNILRARIEESFAESEISLHTGTESLCDYYAKSMNNILNDIAPIRRKVCYDKPRAPWFNDELIIMRRNVRKRERKWKSTKLVVDHEIFIASRLEYCRRADTVKADFHRCRIDKASVKDLFTIIDELIGSKKIRTSIKPTTIPIDALPDRFLNFFNDKVSKLLNGTIAVRDSGTTVDTSNQSISEFAPVTEDKIVKLIGQLPCKSCTLDILPTRLIKDCIIQLSPFITRLFNYSLTSGVVPNSFKLAIIKPLIKKQSLDHNLLSSYRPISNLSFLSKSLERIVAEQLNSYLSCNKLFAKCQSAYRANHSTETALLRVHNDIMMALNSKKDVILIMLDLSAAFDTLNHELLLNRLKSRFGICGNVYNWFKSYLSDRYQRVEIESVSSKSSKLVFGVPQGSVLGPILFSLYTAPLEDIIYKHNCDYMLYADDTQIYVVCDRPADVISSLETCVDDIRGWMLSNQLVLNDNKTEVIKFTSSFKKNAQELNVLRVGTYNIAPMSFSTATEKCPAM